MLDENFMIKIIDFGGATYDHEQHNSIINTRQYRAPEVILRCEDWTKKSDIWSMVCILIEMYTGELFYQAREEVEHLAMIEKQCGVSANKFGKKLWQKRKKEMEKVEIS